MKEYWSIGLRALPTLDDFNSYFHISNEYISEIEKILKENNVPFGKFLSPFYDNWTDEGEIDKLYKHFKNQIEYFEGKSWWKDTEVAKKYDRRSTVGYLTRKDAERIIKELSDALALSKAPKREKYIVHNQEENGNTFDFKLSYSEVINFFSAYKEYTEKLNTHEKILHSVCEFVERHDLNLPSLQKTPKAEETPSAEYFEDKSYIGLE